MNLVSHGSYLFWCDSPMCILEALNVHILALLLSNFGRVVQELFNCDVIKELALEGDTENSLSDKDDWSSYSITTPCNRTNALHGQRSIVTTEFCAEVIGEVKLLFDAS